MMQWYEAEVASLEQSLASAGTHEDHPPVFYGSSSFRLWDTLAADVAPGILNLAFGGSTLAACDHFFNRLVPPANPRSLLLYAGDNDLGDGQRSEAVLASFRSLADRLAASLGPIPFGFISVKPSPARSGILHRIQRLNQAVRRDIESRPNGFYVDVFTAMLDPAGQPNPAWFHPDGLHLNRDGYRLWGRLLQPYRNQIFIS
jgi:lysophospholipase L1-like esterase